ncbi:MAG TPA: amidase [Candidatus Tectomicrobia bacterium]|nr:amidase [Candidatus Tectomicrobia bacterium]
MVDLTTLTIAEAARRMERKELSPVELTQAALGRISSFNPQLNAFITILADQAISTAKIAEQEMMSGQRRGPLHGMPIALKDLCATRGVRTTAGSKILQDHVPTYDATVALRLAEAGTILLGKLHMNEFAYGPDGDNAHYGRVRNPWNQECITGGSSSGSGAALAASLCLGALGTDTGGSIRIPSALCGIVGIKPTYGRVSRYGITPLCWSLDHAGPMARTVEDVALLLQTMAGYDVKDPSSAPHPVPDYAGALSGDVRGLRIGIPREYFFEMIDAEVEAAVRQAIAVIEGSGASVHEVSWPSLRYVTLAALIIVLAEASAFHDAWIRTRPQDYHPDIALRLKWGLLLPASAYAKAQRLRMLMCRDVAQLWRQVDILVTPATMMAAPRAGEAQICLGNRQMSTREAILRLMRPFNLTGLPAISVPCGFTSTGLPIGLQIAGKPFDEATVLRVAHAYEQSTDWHRRRPPMG